MGQRDVIAELRRRCMFPGGCEQPAKRERLCSEHRAAQMARFGLDKPSPRTKAALIEPTPEPPKLPERVSLSMAAAIMAAHGWELVVRPADEAGGHVSRS